MDTLDGHVWAISPLNRPSEQSPPKIKWQIQAVNNQVISSLNWSRGGDPRNGLYPAFELIYIHFGTQ